MSNNQIEGQIPMSARSEILSVDKNKSRPIRSSSLRVVHSSAFNQIEGQPMSARSEILSVDKKRSLPVRSASQRIVRPSAPACCADCKRPLLSDINARETLNKSRAVSTFQTENSSQECTQEKGKNGRNTSSRLVKSASVNWSHMNDNIETWFEKARTPDQQVVYNFLHEINNNQNEKTTEKTSSAKDLDDVLNNLKKYQTRFNSDRRNKLTRLFQSSSWRVMRHPVNYNQNTYQNVSTSNNYPDAIFTRTYRKMGSTFLIHPNWI